MVKKVNAATAQTAKYCREEGQETARTGNRQDCAHRGRKHGPQFGKSGLNERPERSSSRVGLKATLAEIRDVAEANGFFMCICFICINTSNFFVVNQCHAESIRFFFPELGRRRIRVQTTATDPSPKPSTLPLSTTPSAETYCYSAEPTPFSSRNISHHKTNYPSPKRFFPKHTVFRSPTDAKPAAGVGLIAAQENQVHESHPADRETRVLQTAGTRRQIQHRHGIIHCADGHQFVRMAGSSKQYEPQEEDRRADRSSTARVRHFGDTAEGHIG